MTLVLMLVGMGGALLRAELEPAAATAVGDAAGAYNAVMTAIDDKGSGAVAPAAVATATKGILGSKHDFSTLTGRASDACGACHVPHLQAVQPRKGSAQEGLLELFRIGNQRAALSPGEAAPGATSLICLSCHHGTVASSTIGTAHALVAGHRAGFELDDFAVRDHPIGVDYPAGRKGYHPAARALQMGIRLPEGRVECISCHDPHHATGLPWMLSVTVQRSALCLACHDK